MYLIYYDFFIFILAVVSLCCFLWLLRAGASLPRTALASHWRGFSCCGAWALGVWIAETHSLVAPQHVGSFQTKDWTGVPSISRQILNHGTTRQALVIILDSLLWYLFIWVIHLLLQMLWFGFLDMSDGNALEQMGLTIEVYFWARLLPKP